MAALKDSRLDDLTGQQAVDVMVSSMAVELANYWAMKKVGLMEQKLAGYLGN